MGKERKGAPSSFVIVCMLDRLDIRLNDDFKRAFKILHYDFKRGVCLMFVLILSMNTFIIILLGGLRYDDI